MPNYPDLRGHVVLITGGANGIGAAMVRGFHSQQAEVLFCDVDRAAGKSLARELGPTACFQAVDLRSEQSIKGWISEAGARYRRIDILINNAASDPRIPLDKTSTAAWDDLFALNLRAYFLTCREAIRWMLKGSSIINFSSVTFHNAPKDMSAYVATKAGIIGLTRSLARELGPRRIRVNVISPGWTMTDRQLKEYVTPSAKRLIRSAQCIPDFIQPSEIAEVALFLASAASSAITGQEILADRGWDHS
jgi:NAD(P)-dependent dehydrogenase (short-subunit alcohol dehydrogenase family)